MDFHRSASSMAFPALVSRGAVFLLQIVFNIFPDHAADAFKPKVDEVELGILDKIPEVLFDGFHKWDAKYFLHIAEHGYEEEKMFAFFPMFPAMLRGFASILPFPDTLLSFYSRLLLAGFILNTAFFVGATVAIFYLTMAIYQDRKFAILCSILFSFNPASIFFSSNYTEALYSFCVFNGLFHLEKRSYFLATSFFVGASATRSNGTVNAGFVAYYAIKEIFSVASNSENKVLQQWTAFKIIGILIRTAASCILIFLPFIAFITYGHGKFCSQRDGVPEWCEASFPNIYSHVQKQHWDVGLFMYYRIRKIPNFILALPCALLVAYGIFHYLRANRIQIVSLGLLTDYTNSKHNKLLEFAKVNVFVYVCHSLFLLLFGICFMHIEVITRFLFSSSPLPIWVASSLIYADTKAADITLSMQNLLGYSNIFPVLSAKSKLVYFYFLLYIIVGTFMHVNYLPWT
ncbi:GPI alpha-1,6-mannosyltransferase 2-like isoform X1 [Styela clava]